MISQNTFSDMPKKLKQALILVLIYLFALAIVSEKSLDQDYITLFVIEVMLIGFLIFKIKERKNWAKLMLLVIFMLNALGLFVSLITEVLSPETILMAPITAILLITVITILNLLLNKSSDHWFNNSVKNQISRQSKNIRKLSRSKYAFLIPVLLSTFGFILGFIHERNLAIGTGGLEILFFLFLALILGLALIVFIVLLFKGKKKENQSLIDVSKISLFIISIPLSFIIGFFVSKNF